MLLRAVCQSRLSHCLMTAAGRNQACEKYDAQRPISHMLTPE